MKRIIQIIGILAILIGLVWIGQGTGYFPYPRTSFMISQTPWVYRGVVLELVGVVMLILSLRRSRRGRNGGEIG